MLLAGFRISKIQKLFLVSDDLYLKVHVDAVGSAEIACYVIQNVTFLRVYTFEILSKKFPQ